MRIDILTLFPETLGDVLSESILGRAQERGFIKVVAHKDTKKVLGAQMMCARATDMISEFGTAISADMTLDQMRAVIRPHPTFSEGITEAVTQ